MRWFRVQYPGLDRYLGYGAPRLGTRGLPSLVPVLEPEAECFEDPRTAAEIALMAGILPFTIEEAK